MTELPVLWLPPRRPAAVLFATSCCCCAGECQPDCSQPAGSVAARLFSGDRAAIALACIHWRCEALDLSDLPAAVWRPSAWSDAGLCCSCAGGCERIRAVVAAPDDLPYTSRPSTPGP